MKSPDLRSPEKIKCIQRYARGIVHMRQQLRHDHFGLVFGAGIGKQFGFPDWEGLLSRIADDPNVDGRSIVERTTNLTARAQQLFQKFKAKSSVICTNGDGNHFQDEMRLKAGWRKIVHECLYRDVPVGKEELLKKDSYLVAFSNIIKRSSLTVTYNFDDTLERILAYKRTDEERQTMRGYTTYWSGNIQLNAKRGVIYHPNGFLPRELRDKPSDQLVFLEDSFADQLIDSMSGYYASLSVHMSQTTCLFVGISLNDPTLKHLLRQSARSFPGHYHYLIRAVEEDTVCDTECQALEFAANFDVYNLITLHLTVGEIRGLAELLSIDDSEFQAFAEEHVKESCFRYFVTGSVSVGKSTLVNNMRALLTQDEWTEERAPGMEKAPDMLLEEEKQRIDAWVADQVASKNINLMKYTTGIHLIDRAPLDAFAFTEPKLWKEKANLLRSAVSPGLAHERALLGGHVILLIGDPDMMAARALSLHKVTTPEKLRDQQEMLKAVYSKLGDCVTMLDTRGKSIAEVTRECANIIFYRGYQEASLDGRLEEILNNGYDGPI